MKREIKFRAWDGNRMFYFDNHAFVLEYNDISGWNVYKNLPFDQLKGLKYDAGESSKTADKFELMQFTGLHDKNGKEIYESDIIKFEISDIKDGEIISIEYGVVRFSESGYWTSQDEGQSEELLSEELEWKTCKCTVVGNVFENPELLNHNL